MPDELSRLCTSCGFLSIQQTFPEHPLPVIQPVGDGGFARKREGRNPVISSSRLNSRHCSWLQMPGSTGGRTMVRADTAISAWWRQMLLSDVTRALCAQALAWTSACGPFCFPPLWSSVGLPERLVDLTDPLEALGRVRIIPRIALQLGQNRGVAAQSSSLALGSSPPSTQKGISSADQKEKPSHPFL